MSVTAVVLLKTSYIGVDKSSRRAFCKVFVCNCRKKKRPILGQKEFALKKKIIIASLLLFVVAFSSFAKAGVYLKAAGGFGIKSLGGVYDEFDLFVTPGIGITPWATSQNGFLKGLSFELTAEIGFDLGAKDEWYRIGAAPALMVLYGRQFGRLTPYLGLGASALIFSTRQTAEKYGWNVNAMIGVGYAVTDTIMPFVEVFCGYGYNNSAHDTTVDVRAGIVYTISGRRIPPATSSTRMVTEGASTEERLTPITDDTTWPPESLESRSSSGNQQQPIYYQVQPVYEEQAQGYSQQQAQGYYQEQTQGYYQQQAPGPYQQQSSGSQQPADSYWILRFEDGDLHLE